MTPGREWSPGLWRIRDTVTRLRVWGSDQFHELGGAPASEYWISFSSSGETPTLEVGSAGHRFAHVSYRGGAWTIQRLQNAAPMLIDGVPCDRADLAPGMEINTGTLVLVAESEHSIQLRCFLSRVLGWGQRNQKVVDGALRRIRSLQLRGLPFVLQGEGSLVPIAHDLHYYLHPLTSPFVVCDPHRQSGAASAMPPLNVEDLEPALAAAVGGSLCIRNERPPDGFERLLQHTGDSRPASQVIICDDGSRPSVVPEVEAIALPSLMTRADQVDHIVFEYALDVCTSQGVGLNHEDRAWIKTHSSATLGQICEAVTRLAALQVHGSISRAAEWLNLPANALRRWIRRSGSPPHLSVADAVSVESENCDLDA